MSWMINKAEFYGQAATQGGTNPLMLPLWMSQPWAKPLTLFTRIATSVTAGMWTHAFRPIWEVGNPMPLVRYAAGSVFTGAGLYAFYKYILGQDQMHEMSDDKWKTVLQMAWRAEFLGMFSNVLNPHMSPIYGSTIFLHMFYTSEPVLHYPVCRFNKIFALIIGSCTIWENFSYAKNKFLPERFLKKLVLSPHLVELSW